MDHNRDSVAKVHQKIAFFAMRGLAMNVWRLNIDRMSPVKRAELFKQAGVYMDLDDYQSLNDANIRLALKQCSKEIAKYMYDLEGVVLDISATLPYNLTH